MIVAMTPEIQAKNAREVADVLDRHFGFRAITSIADAALGAPSIRGVDDERWDAFWYAVRADGLRRRDEFADSLRDEDFNDRLHDDAPVRDDA